MLIFFSKNLRALKNYASNPISGNIPEGTQNTNLKEHKHHYVHCSIIYNPQHMEVAQESISR